MSVNITNSWRLYLLRDDIPTQLNTFVVTTNNDIRVSITEPDHAAHMAVQWEMYIYQGGKVVASDDGFVQANSPSHRTFKIPKSYKNTYVAFLFRGVRRDEFVQTKNFIH